MSIDDILNPSFLPIEGYAWHVMRVPYGRERAVAEQLASDECLPYVPALKISNLLFLYTNQKVISYLHDYQITFPDSPRRKPVWVRHLYDHTRKNSFGIDTPMTVSLDEMRSFIIVTRTADEHVQLVESPLAIGQMVEVTEGRFAGVRGTLARVRRQRCVIVNLKDVCSVATAYIPRAFLKPIP